jgi:hypothetical protein
MLSTDVTRLRKDELFTKSTINLEMWVVESLKKLATFRPVPYMLWKHVDHSNSATETQKYLPIFVGKESRFDVTLHAWFW